MSPDESTTGKYGICHFMDCVEGMRKYIRGYDLCLTDPPYFINFHEKAIEEKVRYDDTKEFTLEWLDIALSVCKMVIFTPGHSNVWKYPEAKQMLCWYKGGNRGRNMSGGANLWEPLLVYGKGKIDADYIFAPILLKKGFIHPCPKPVKLFKTILEWTKPARVIDPFMGSGTLAQAAEELRIPWVGFELESAYKVDIEKRIRIADRSKTRRLT